jgi:opacity protein-like surface antigen
MKLLSSTLLAGLACIALVPFASAGAETNELSKLYLRADLGAAWMENATLQEFLGYVPPGSTVKFDPGIRVGISVGYEFTDWFAAEGQIGIDSCQIDSISGGSHLNDASVTTVPYLLNVRLQLPGHPRFTPYIGGGGGFAISVLYTDNLNVNGTTLDGTSATAIWAYQAFGGLRYDINSKMSVSVEYHYTGTSAPDWEIDSTAGTQTDNVKFGDLAIQSVSAAFTYRF